MNIAINALVLSPTPLPFAADFITDGVAQAPFYTLLTDALNVL